MTVTPDLEEYVGGLIHFALQDVAEDHLFHPVLHDLVLQLVIPPCRLGFRRIIPGILVLSCG